MQKETKNIIRVEDNEVGLNTEINLNKSGGDTKQGRDLAKQLNDNFRRYSQQPKGTVCELTWPIDQSWFWNF